jgi:hypothetical protein
MNDLNDSWEHLFQQTHGADPVEIQRVRLLLDGADKQLRKVDADRERHQIESAQGRVDFYDRLTIGAGATIAALV